MAKKPTICSNPECPREIHADWTYCRPCATAHVNGDRPYIEACVGFVKPASLVKECPRCGYENGVHPGRGIQRESLIMPPWEGPVSPQAVA